MFKHKNEGNGTVTFTDDSGNQHIFYPGGTISLDKKYTKAEAYGIYCIDAEQKEIVEEEKPKRKKKEMIHNDSTDN